jgi:hypothetical protein
MTRKRKTTSTKRGTMSNSACINLVRIVDAGKNYQEWKEEAHKNVPSSSREVLSQTFICIEIQFIKHVGN